MGVLGSDAFMSSLRLEDTLGGVSGSADSGITFFSFFPGVEKAAMTAKRPKNVFAESQSRLLAG